MTTERAARIEDLLVAEFEPASILVKDQSHLHAGHAGAKDGRGHFHVKIVAEAFAGKSRLERHRLVFGALGNLMQTDIHALNVTALAPDEQ